MVWIKVKKIILSFAIALVAFSSQAQESLWKAFNEFPEQEVTAYSGSLSPFPQKQKKIEELEFEISKPLTSMEIIETDKSLSPEEKRVMLTTSILAEIKEFLATEAVFIPNLSNLVVEATASSNGKSRALVKGRWVVEGDKISVPVNEAENAIDLLDRLRDVDPQIAETVENAVLDRTEGKTREIVKLVKIKEDKIVLVDSRGQEYVVNFIKAPY